MDLDNRYSEQWNDLIESAIVYQNRLRDFFLIKNEIFQRDLQQALHDKALEYYALRVIEQMPEKRQFCFLEDLFYVVICGSVSNAYLAKQIIVKMKYSPLLKEKICELSQQYSLDKGKDDIYIIKDIAMFLYELKYKECLLKYVEDNMEALKKSEFIESDNDLLKIKDMDETVLP